MFGLGRKNESGLHPERVRLAHISGIARPDLGPPELTETDFGRVFLGDRAGNNARHRAMVDAAYQGFVSIRNSARRIFGTMDMIRKGTSKPVSQGALRSGTPFHAPQVQTMETRWLSHAGPCRFRTSNASLSQRQSAPEPSLAMKPPSRAATPQISARLCVARWRPSAA